MESGPFSYQPPSTNRRPAVKELSGESESSLVLTLVDMEMGWGMVIVVHGNDQPVETGDARHARKDERPAWRFLRA